MNECEVMAELEKLNLLLLKQLYVYSHGGALQSLVTLQWMHHHMTATEASRPITELAAEEGAELHRSELQHLKVKLETWK